MRSWGNPAPASAGPDEKAIERFKVDRNEFCFKSSQAMLALVKDFPDAVPNTVKIAGQCNLQLPLGKKLLPSFPVPEGKTADGYLEKLGTHGKVTSPR